MPCHRTGDHTVNRTGHRTGCTTNVILCVPGCPSWKCTYDVYTSKYIIYTHVYIPGMYIYIYFLFFHPIYYLRPSILSLQLVVTQIRGHIAGSSPPLPTAVRALHFYREKLSALSCLVDSRRIVLPYTRHSPQLILLYLGK